MAQSRLEKVGTIYSRVTSLLKTGAMKEDNKPIWLEIYRVFPPKYEPHFARETPPTILKPIFYSEDKIRARFHNDYKNYSMINLLDKSVSKTENFINIYRQLEKEGIPEEQLYDKAVEEFFIKFKHEKPQKEKKIEEPLVPQPKLVRTRRTHRSDNANLTKESIEQPAEDNVIYKPIKLKLDKIMSHDEEGSSKKSDSK